MRALGNIFAAAAAMVPKAVDDRDLVPLGKIGIGNRRPDETGPACNQNSHDDLFTP
jgi:hypothetical protein